MANYAPKTLEKNLANIVWMKEKYFSIINDFIWNYNAIHSIFYNQFYFMSARNLGFIRPDATLESEMTRLSYAVYGFVNDLFHRTAHALECWDITRRNSTAGFTTENYLKHIRTLKDKKLINKSDEPLLKEFRDSRHYATHCGKISFVSYIFNNSNLIYNLLCIAEDLLRKEGHINELEYQKYLDSQTNFITALEYTLKEFSICNNIA